MFSKVPYTYQENQNKLDGLLSETKLTFFGDVLLYIEGRLDLFEPLIRNMLKNNTVDENIDLIQILSSYPNLIGLATDALVNDKKPMVREFRSKAHPPLSQLAHQSAFLYKAPLIDNPKYDGVRTNLESFLKELKLSVPEYFAITDEYDMTPDQRLKNLGVGRNERTANVYDLLSSAKEKDSISLKSKL